MRSHDLGELDGVKVAFSDATPLADEILVFTASAEAPGDDAGEDSIHGSVVGTIDLDGTVRRMRTIDRRYKVEGVHATIDTGVIDFLFVCDHRRPRRMPHAELQLSQSARARCACLGARLPPNAGFGRTTRRLSATSSQQRRPSAIRGGLGDGQCGEHARP